MALRQLAPRTIDPMNVGARGNASEVYRPVCVVRLLVRLEDFSNADGQDAQDEGKPARRPASRAIVDLNNLQALQSVRRASGEADPKLDAKVKLAKKKAAAAKSGKTKSANAPAPMGSPGDDFSFELIIVPQAITVSLNGFRTADKVSLDIALQDLPLPPDIVRSMFVEVFMDEAAVNDYTDQSRWIPKVFQSPPMFRGYCDEETLEADESTLKISITAQSLEARLIASKINPLTKERRIEKGGETLVNYVQKLISTIPEFNGTLGGAAIGVRLFPNVDPAKEPLLNAKLFKRSLQSAQSRAQAGGQVQPTPAIGGVDPAQTDQGGTPIGVGMPGVNPTTADISVWDVVTRAANLSGYIPIYDPSIVQRNPDGSVEPVGANNILLLKPQNLFETPRDGVTYPGGPVDGFSRDIDVGGLGPLHSEVRFMVWGHNIRSMKMGRKYGREKAPRVRVICHNPDGPPGKRTLEAVFPKSLRGTAVSAVGSLDGKGHPPITEEIVRVVYEVRRQEELDRIAASLYHAVGQREVVCTIDTDELSSYFDRTTTEGRNPDLLRLRPGSPVRVVVARQIQDPAGDNFVVNGLSELFDRRSNPAFLRKMIARGQDFSQPILEVLPRIEAALAKIENSFQAARLTDFFYCRTVEHRWSDSEGFSCTIELCNYQEARNNPRNLSKDDRAVEDAEKAIKPGVAPDARRAAIDDNVDQLLTSILGGG